MKPVAVLPALCTLGNAFCGFLAIAKGVDAVAVLWRAPVPVPQEQLDLFHHLFAIGCGLIFLANVFDALDGRLARMAKATSDFGAMLDSLADLLTFGAAPALMTKLLYESTLQLEEQPFKPKWVLLMCFLYVACAAIRLARFTAETDDDPESHDFFKGLPTPAAASFVAAGILFYVHLGDPEAHVPRFLADHRGGFLTFLLACMPLLAIMMISHVKYVHVVNRYIRGRRPYTYVVAVVVVLLLLVLEIEWALVVICMGYVLVCPIISLLEILLKRPLWPPPPGDDKHPEPEAQ